MQSKNSMLWRPVIGYEGLYEVSNTGLVRSLKRFGNLKKPFLGNSGYIKVTLYSKELGCKQYFVHRLVALAFIPNPLNKKWVNHKNGIKIDNQLENLEWSTPSENHFHAFRMGLDKRVGEKSNLHKIRQKDVLFIRDSSLSIKELAIMFGLTTNGIGKILLRKCWKYI